MSAEARMVRLPPPSMLRAAPRKRFRRVERRGVHAAGQDAARCRLRQVVGAREARERVQQHDHVLAALHKALGALDDQLGHGDVVLRGHVERGGHDLALDGALHVGDFLGTLVHEQAHEVHVGVVRGGSGCDVLQHRGLAGLRRADDQAALALADGAHKVDDAGRDGVLAVLHMEALVGVDRREVAEAHPVAALLDGRSVDGRDLLDGGVLLVLARRARLPGHHIALAQAVAADGGQAHVAVRLAGQVALRAREAVSVGQDVQDAGHLDEALGLHAGPEHGLDELGLLEAGGVHSQLGRLLAQLGHLELGQIVARHAGLHLAGTAVVVVRTALAAVVVVVVLLAAGGVLALVVLLLAVALVLALAALVAAGVLARALGGSGALLRCGLAAGLDGLARRLGRARCGGCGLGLRFRRLVGRRLRGGSGVHAR